MNEPLQPTLPEAELARAADLLRAGGLVAFPTETVYGLGADATNPIAVARIYEAKGRPSFNPLISHVASIELARELVEFNDLAERLASAFWPGPLTLVLPDRGVIHELTRAGLPSAAVRMPAHPLAHELLLRVGRPVCAPSANPSGCVSPTRAEHVRESLGARIDMVLDGGPCRIGLESTVVATSASEVRLLRAGSITREELEASLGVNVVDGVPVHAATQRFESPGQLQRHYATQTPMRLLSGGDQQEAQPGDVCLLAVLEPAPELKSSYRKCVVLSPDGDLLAAASKLFSTMRELDQQGFARIDVLLAPEAGVGVAINDRLRRAAFPA